MKSVIAAVVCFAVGFGVGRIKNSTKLAAIRAGVVAIVARIRALFVKK